MLFETPRLRIRPMKMTDLEAVYQHRKNPETAKYIGPPATRATAKARLEQACQNWQGRVDEKRILAIELKHSQQLIGELVFKYTSEDKQRGEIGFRLAAEQIGKGYGFEAADALIQWLFKHTPIQVVSAVCAKENEKSQQLMSRLGMVCHDLQKGKLSLNGKLHDALVYHLKKGEACNASPASA